MELLGSGLLGMPNLDPLNGWLSPGSVQGRVVGLVVVGRLVVSPGWCGWCSGALPGMGVVSLHTVPTRWSVESVGEQVT